MVIAMIILKGVHAVDTGSDLNGIVDIIIENGKIAAIGPDAAADKIAAADPGDQVVDCTGLTAMPGLVDVHCHLREPGQEYKEDIESGCRAAAKGGFTAIACMPNTKPAADNSAVISAILKKAKEKGCVKVYPIGAISKGLEGKELSEMGDMQEAGAVAVSDDGRPVMSSGLMKKAMIYSAQFQLPIISHCEDLDLTDDGYMNEGCCSTMLGLRGIPRAAEENMVSRELILAEYTGLPVHIAHVSTKLAAELIRQAKARGVRVTCETCPHYFTLTDHAVIGFDTNAKVNPPLREQADVEAIIAALQDGTIDMIATDHAPHHADEKNVEFALAANGISGFETAFGLSYTYLVKAGHLTFPELVRKMSVNPGRFLRIGSRLAAGAAADITLAALEEEYTVDVRQFVSKGKNSPFDGFRLFGRIAGTIVNGRIVYGIGRIAAAIA